MTPMQARDAMMAVFMAQWQALGFDPARIVWDDEQGGVPAGEAPWARATLKHGDAPFAGFGDGVAIVDNNGVLIIQLFTTAGANGVDAYTVAHGVVTAFRVAKVGVWFRNTRLREVGQSGAFTQTNVVSEFTYDDR